VDEVLAGPPAVFEETVLGYAARLATRTDYASLVESKRAARAADERRRPLESYRAEELALMRLDIFDDRRGFAGPATPSSPSRPDLPGGTPSRRRIWCLGQTRRLHEPVILTGTGSGTPGVADGRARGERQGTAGNGRERQGPATISGTATWPLTPR
jgi:hypothetical protein